MVYSRFILSIFLYSFFQIIHASGTAPSECKPDGTTEYIYKSYIDSKTFTSSTKQSVCIAVVEHANSLNNGDKYTLTTITGESSGYCNVNITSPSGSQTPGGFNWIRNTNPDYSLPPCKDDKCPTEGSKQSAFFRKNGELLRFPSEICIDKCLYRFDNPILGQEVRSDGHITTVFSGTAVSRQQSCPKDTESDKEPPINKCKTKNDKGDLVDKDYCDADDSGKCPEGYKSGSFNGKKVCVKQDQNDKDNCKPTISDPHKCLNDKPTTDEPDKDGNCKDNLIQVIVGNTLKCVSPEHKPDPDGGCEKGYVKQTFEGVSTCVANNQPPTADGGCPLNTSLVTLDSGKQVCQGKEDGNGNGNGDGEGDGETGGNGSCDPSKDFLCKEYDLPDFEKLAVNEVDLPEIKTDRLNWSASCPAPIVKSVALGTKTKELKFEFDKVCPILTDYISPLMHAFAYLSAAFIIVGAVRT